MILLSLLDKILRLFGTSEQRLRWRLERWRNQREGRRRGRENVNRHLTYRHKTCDVCGQVLDRDARRCPHCDSPVASWGAKLGEKVVTRLTPGVGSMTSTLLLGNGVIFFYVAFATGDLWNVSSYTSILFGGNYGPLMAAGNEWWRLVTANFLHVGGLIHVGFNLVALAMIGPLVEEWYGTARAVVIYVLTGIISAVTSHLWAPLAVSGGASGAVLGLIGAGVVAGHLDGSRVGLEMRNSLLRWFAYVAVFGLLVAGIDNAAHLGGFVAGLVIGAGLRRELRPAVWKAWLYRGLALALTLLCLVSLAIAFWSARGLPPKANDVALERAWVECRDAIDEAEPDRAARACQRYARFYAYGHPLVTHLAAELLREAGRDREARRILAVMAATEGYSDPGQPGPGFVQVARQILESSWR